MNKVKVRIPATTANLGPGFDFLGLALKLYNTVELEAERTKKDKVSIEIKGEGERTLPRGKENIVYKAIKKILTENYNIHIKLDNKIPIARGLGSSAAARIGGLVAANRVRGNKFTDNELLDKAAKLEGHPDNAAAALLGGFVVTVRKGKKLIAKNFEVNRRLLAVLCIPDFEVSTQKARQVLPPPTEKRYSRQDYVSYASSAVALSLMTRKADYGDFSDLTEDIFHQPFREQLVPGMKDVFKEAEKAGAMGVFLSGSGPTIVALTDSRQRAKRVGNSMMKAFAKYRHNGRKINSNIVVTNADNQGKKILKQ